MEVWTFLRWLEDRGLFDANENRVLYAAPYGEYIDPVERMFGRSRESRTHKFSWEYLSLVSISG